MSVDEYKQKGNDAFKEKKFQLSIDFYTKAIELDPDNHLLYSNRATSYFSIKNYSEAIKDAKKCIELKRDFVKGYYRLAQCVFELKDYPGANLIYKKALELDPTNETIKKQIQIVEQKLKLIQKKDNFIKNMATLDGQIRVDLETINLYLHTMSLEKSKKISFDIFKLRSIILNLRFKGDDLKDLIPQYSFIKESYDKDSISTLFIVCCELYQHGFLIEAQQYALKLLSIKKDTTMFTLLAHIEIYLHGSNPLVHLRKIFTNQLPLDLFSIKTYLELTSNAVDSFEEAERRLSEIMMILKSKLNFSYGWVTEIGLKSWFFLLNNSPGSLMQLTESMEDDEKLIKILNSPGEQPLVRVLLNEVFLHIISRNIIGRQDVESFFIKLRFAFLSMHDGEINEYLIPLMVGIAYQADLNEYIWQLTEGETKILLKLIDEIEQEGIERDMSNKKRNMLIIISMYQPLFRLKCFSNGIISKNSEFNKLLDHQKFDCKFPNVSPKWNYFADSLVKIPYHKMIEWSFPSQYWPSKQFEVEGKISKMLITGCSTGEILVKSYHKYSNVDILGIESNEESIKYFKEKTKGKINAVCSDDGMFNQQNFEIIEAYGLKNEIYYEKAASNLVDALIEGGVIKFEFYSKKFVTLVFKARRFLNENNFEFFNKETLEPEIEPNENEKRNIRDAIMKNDDLKMLSSRFEFYQLNTCVEILFQKNLIGMDFIDIEKFIASLSLKLIAFILPPQVMDQYAKSYPHDKHGKKFSLLDKFDQKNNFVKDIIAFYCEKPETEQEQENESDPLGVKNYLHKFTK